MAKYDIRDLQMRLLKILQMVDNVCKEHNLDYYLWAGTMLGAVRHGGFIPWDDDADIAMPRPCYDILVEHASEWLPYPYELTCFEYNPKFTGTYAKIIDSSTTLIERYDFKSLGGIYIDLFPIDGVCDNGIRGKMKLSRYSYYKKIAYFCNRNPYKHGKGISSWLPRLIQSRYTNADIQGKAISLMKECEYDSADYVCDFDDGAPGIMPKEYLGRPVPIMFEGIELKGVERSDAYLRHKYGDYMTIPSVEHQRQHDFYYLDYDLPYRQYKDEREFVS